MFNWWENFRVMHEPWPLPGPTFAGIIFSCWIYRIIIPKRNVWINWVRDLLRFTFTLDINEVYFCPVAIILGYQLSTLIWKIKTKNSTEGKQDVAWCVNEVHFSRMQIMNLEATTRGTFLSSKLTWFFHKLYIILFHMLETLYLWSSFSSVTLGILASATAKCTTNDEMTRVISVGTRIKEVSLPIHISETSAVTYLFYCIFQNRHWWGTC